MRKKDKFRGNTAIADGHEFAKLKKRPAYTGAFFVIQIYRLSAGT
ncbi:hypothetical protein I33_3466 [Bacillus subtilis subsp. subtilis str. RO-NN-1]|nr:hypothetical protein I33_3466 [Bacillus subtilis subsp. subtilis str. RO-NN-1]